MEQRTIEANNGTTNTGSKNSEQIGKRAIGQ
jgi:hypothetical protein